MKLHTLTTELTTSDHAIALHGIACCVAILDKASGEWRRSEHFPDRTPRDKLEAIAKAINDALSAAREIEGDGRD